jgi:uncharacterized protein YjaZ
MKEGGKMGIVETNDWLDKDFRDPIKICGKLVPYFKNQKAIEIYKQLLEFGMYHPSIQTKETVDILKKGNAWDQVKSYYEHYRKKWSGPDIPIFIFPLDKSRGFFTRQEQGKSGVSFPDKIFLFLSKLDDPRELEALFIHEYHHVCRLNSIKGNMENYTLLDSIIIEGLAEYTVWRNCGKKYLANWCNMYSKDDIENFWSKYLKNNLDCKKNERLHDQLLYGYGRIPKLLGYAAGFELVKTYYEDKSFSTKPSFSLPSEDFIIMEK